MGRFGVFGGGGGTGSPYTHCPPSDHTITINLTLAHRNETAVRLSGGEAWPKMKEPMAVLAGRDRRRGFRPTPPVGGPAGRTTARNSGRPNRPAETASEDFGRHYRAAVQPAETATEDFGRHRRAVVRRAEPPGGTPAGRDRRRGFRPKIWPTPPGSGPGGRTAGSFRYTPHPMCHLKKQNPPPRPVK